MRKFSVFALLMALACPVHASWYWPFGSDAVEEEKLRISELMQPATEMIDKASDLADEGKVGEAIEEYSKVIAELDKIERENPGRAEGAEFATLRNKRAYVLSTIDSLRMKQVKDNEKAVVVSDTSALEKRLAEEKAKKVSKKEPPKKEPPKEVAPKKEEVRAKAEPPAKPRTRREQAIVAVAKGDFKTAERIIDEMLAEKPNGAVPLNLRAAMLARQGKVKDAEETLDRAITSNPKNHFAYYNMANLLLMKNPDDTSAAKRYYETGRAFGGPVDEKLEAVFK